MTEKIIIGIVISTISGILLLVFRGSLVKLFDLLKNKFKKLRLNQIERNSFKNSLSLKEEFKNRHKIIVDGFSDCLDYQKTCSMTNILNDIQRLQHSEATVLSCAIKETNIIKEWYSCYINRIDAINSSYIIITPIFWTAC